MTDQDIPVVGHIWLAASLQAHHFVPAGFWHADHKTMTTELLPGCDGYVHETDGRIDGFVVLGDGERGNFMGALFVSPEHHRGSARDCSISSKGCGTRLRPTCTS